MLIIRTGPLCLESPFHPSMTKAAESYIPTIHLDDPDKTLTVTKLRSACVDVGFFYLEGHGIPEVFLNEVMVQSKALFDLPLEEKFKLQDCALNRGYTAMEEETLDPAHQTKGDTKEGFYIGKDVPVEESDLAKLSGPNQWPTESCPDFKATMTSYQEQVSHVGLRLVQLLALAIGLDDEHYFDEYFADPIVTLRLLHYAKERSHPEEGVFACGAHSDYGMLTFLLTDDTPGLEIYDANTQDWKGVPPKPFAFVVNLGDMLERWTNGKFRSTLHRVLTAGDKERYSVPVFYDPHFDTVVKVLDVCCIDEPAKYPQTTVGQHLMDKYRETHSAFKQ